MGAVVQIIASFQLGFNLHHRLPPPVVLSCTAPRRNRRNPRYNAPQMGVRHWAGVKARIGLVLPSLLSRRH
jgi:hypothetical protein